MSDDTSTERKRLEGVCACCKQAYTSSQPTTLEGSGRYAPLAERSERRPAPRPDGALRLHFDVTSDEEWASLRVVHQGRTLHFGKRMHHYCLVTLARRRVADALAGLDVGAQGWLNRGRLSALLRVDSSHLNVLLFRARHQWSSLLAPMAAESELIESERGVVRLGAFAFCIRRGEAEETVYPAPV